MTTPNELPERCCGRCKWAIHYDDAKTVIECRYEIPPLPPWLIRTSPVASERAYPQCPCFAAREEPK
jgi:hypothetical protein